MDCRLSALDQILDEIKALQRKSLAKRVFTFTKDPEKIVSMRKVLDDAVGLFQVRAIPPKFEDYTLISHCYSTS